MPELTIGPRRVTATSTLHLLPEPRFAWLVPQLDPWTVEEKPRWQIVAMTYGTVAVEYEASPGAGRQEANLLYDAADAAASQAAAFPTIRWVPMGSVAGDELLHPDAVAFSFEDARDRAHLLKTKAESKRADVRS